MKSARKLLVSALASAVLCSPVAHALPVGAMVGIAGGSVAGVATLATIISIACSKKGEKPVDGSAGSSNLNSQSVPSKEDMIKAVKGKITEILGKEKCEVLFGCKRYFKFYAFELLDKSLFLRDVTNLKFIRIVSGKEKTKELSNKEAISSFFNDMSVKIKGWHSRDVMAGLNECFQPIVEVDPYSVVGALGQDPVWGNGIGFYDSCSGVYNGHSIFVSNDLKLVKFCRRVVYDKFEVTIDVSGNQ